MAGDRLVATGRTGGRRDNILASNAFPVRLKELADELINQYLVVYALPQTLIPPEDIEVSAAKPDFRARGTPVRLVKGE